MVVLGGGNTAMDCCRSARRLGGEQVDVVVRSGFEEMKASPWEKEDAMHEGIPIHNFLVPKEFTHENGKLTGITFEKVKAERDAKGRRKLVPSGEPDQHFPCDDVLVAVGQENAFPWIERDVGIEFNEWDMPKVDEKTMASRPIPRCSSAATPPSAPRTSSGRWRTATRPRSRSTRCSTARTSPSGPLPAVELMSQKMGIHEWSYDNEIDLDKRYKVPLRDKAIALKDIKAEVELGFDPELALSEAGRCLNCDVQTVFSASLCIECDACVDICPMDCITFTRNGEEADLRQRLMAPALNLTQDLYVQDGLKTGRVMVKDEDVCLHCGLCAERCPTGAWDMQKFFLDMTYAGTSCRPPTPISRVNDFVVRFANVNGSGSASANEMFARAILRMGVPVAPRNIFPSNIQGLPTWYEVRVSEAGHLGARGGTDLMVAMNPQTFDKDIAGIEPGGYLLYDSTKPLPPSKFRDDIIGHRRAADRDLQPRIFRPAPAPAVQEHHLYRRLDRADRHGRQGGRAADRRAIQGQGKADRAQHPRAASRPRLRHAQFELPDRAQAQGQRQSRRPHLHRGQFGGRARRGLWRGHRLRLVSDHALLLARRRLHPPLRAAARRCAEQASQIRHHPGRGRARLHRHGDRRRLERRARLHRHLRARAFR